MSRRRDRDIAIVGMACRFPGAEDLFAFWSNVLANRDCTSEIPADRWPIDTFFDPDSRENDRVACRRGGYLNAPIPFDAAAHGIMPLAVSGGEPEQFLILEAARNALADASIDVATIDRRRVEVVIGRGNYFNRGNLTRLQHGRIVAQTVGLLASLHPEWTAADLDLLRADLKSALPPFEAATIPGQLTNATAGRIADRLDLAGASFVVDAASASSLVALDLGSRALRERRADLALVGGVYLEADVDFPLVFRQLGALSKSGDSRPFSKEADGMIPGEGAGVVVLKRLRDAEASGDRVYAVIKGVGLASDGRGRGLAAPSARGHARAIRRAYRSAKVDPESVTLLEGHGLGVPAADRAEIRALRAIFPADETRPRGLGAVSSQIGHAMPAAGMAGLIKTALALHHRVLPPTRNAEHPASGLAGSGFELLRKPRPWVHSDPDSPRRAGVNAFGFAGINAHAVLEEHALSADGFTPGALLNWDTEAILLSSASRVDLADRVAWLRDRLQAGHPASLKDIAATLNSDARTFAGPVRLGIVAGSTTDLVQHLLAIEPRLRDPKCRQIKDARGIYFWEAPLGDSDSRLAFLFPGEGSQYPEMLADLCPHFPELRAVFDNADKIARESGEIIPPSRRLFADTSEDAGALWATDTAVTTVLSAQWALYQVLTRLGLKPAAVAGHSSGELLALTAAGALRMERTFERQLSRLSAIFHELEASGAIPEARLAAVGTDRARVDAACQTTGGTVVVAIDNCPHQVVVAGPHAEVERVVTNLRGQGILCEDLPFARAYHTSAFESVIEPLKEFFDRLEFHEPEVPIYSCASADRMPGSPTEARRLAVAQWTLPVEFRSTIEAMHRDGLRIFVDVGARGNLCGYVDDILRGRPAFAVAANLPKRSGTAQLNHLVSSLFAQGLSFDPAYLYARRRPVPVELDAPIPEPRATLPLHIGFPALRLTDTVAAMLRDRVKSALIPEMASSCRARGVSSMSSPQTVNASLGAGPLTVPNPAIEGLLVGEDRGLTPPARQEAALGAGLLTPPEIREASPFDDPMLSFFSSMTDFLGAQSAVLGTFLGGDFPEPYTESPDDVEFVGARRTDDQPGPWVGEICEWEPGHRIVSRLSLDPTDDPVAEHHTIGGRRVSVLDPSLRGLPVVPFSVMAEMIAQVGALLVEPGLVLECLEAVHAHKWVQYGADQLLEMRGEVLEEDPRAVQVSLHQFQVGSSGEGRLVYEAVARFADERPEPVEPEPYGLSEPEACVFTAERLYDEQWLFHGPAMQALVDIGPISLEGASGSIEVLPLGDLLRPGMPNAFHTDPIVVDTFTHLLGCWGLDRFEQGDVIFPLGMGRLTIYGDDPVIGTRVECRIKVREIDRHRIFVDVDLVRPDGLLWITIENWADWRFYWPGRYRDVLREPELVFIGEEMPLDGVSPGEACAVWLEPPADMGRPVWREVLEHTQLGPAERASSASSDRGSELRKTHRIWGRIAGKEAVRRIWQKQGQPPRYPADLSIDTDYLGRLVLRDLADPNRRDVPAVSIAHSGGVAVALAASEPGSPVGIHVGLIEDSSEAFERSVFTPRERSILSAWDGEERNVWVARLRSAKEAAARAIGLELNGNSANVEIVAVDPESGEFAVAPGGRLAPALPELAGMAMRVHTARRDDYAWAWTLGEKAQTP